MNQPAEQPKINATVTNEDLVQCNCGHNLFHAVNRVAIKKNPLVGKPPMCFAMPHAFVCVKCGAELNVDEKLKEREKG